eukprot:765518-Hanusia_phi.AAC.6
MDLDETLLSLLQNYCQVSNCVAFTMFALPTLVASQHGGHQKNMQRRKAARQLQIFKVKTFVSAHDGCKCDRKLHKKLHEILNMQGAIRQTRARQCRIVSRGDTISITTLWKARASKPQVPYCTTDSQDFYHVLIARSVPRMPNEAW